MVFLTVIFFLVQRNVKSLIDSKLEKFKNLWEESHFYWGEIDAGTLKFDRVESEVRLALCLKCFIVNEHYIKYKENRL